MIKKVDRKNRFVAMFNPTTGFYARSGVIDENGHDTGVDPFMTAFPELIDVGVMGHCVHGASGLCFKSGVQCYQNGLKTKEPNMTLENFKRIVDECRGKHFSLRLVVVAMLTSTKILLRFCSIVGRTILCRISLLRDLVLQMRL